MAKTDVSWGDEKAVRRWGGFLFIDAVKKSYFAQRFIGTSDNSVIQQLTDLQTQAGDSIHFDLSVQLRGQPIYGDDVAEGSEEALKFYGDDVYIDQIRKPVSQGGRMANKRTVLNLRNIARSRLSDYYAKFLDEMLFVYLSGARGANGDYYTPTNWTGMANNPIQAPDDAHHMYSGTATTHGTITSSDTMAISTVEKTVSKARMMRPMNPDIAQVLPVTVGTEGNYVMVMSPFDEYNLRTDTNANGTGWLDIQKALASADGRNNAIFKGGLGLINGCVLHSHESVVRFDDAGTGGNLPASRSLFMGRQAGVIAYGGQGAGRFNWTEDTKDYGNQKNIIGGTIVGVKKSRFNNSDFGVIAVDSYSKDPNAA